MRRERATPVAFMRCGNTEKSAAGVVRSQP